MKRSLFALALAAALPFSAQAGELKYSYLQVGYASTDAFDVTFDGASAKGSVAFNDSWYGVASYDQVSESGVDLSETSIGVGYHHPINDKADFFAEAAFVQDDFDVVDSDNGYRATVGVRGLLSDKFEGSFKVSYTDVGDYGNGVGAGLGGVFHINETWGIYGSYDYADRDGFDLNTWGLGVRASF